MTTDLKLPTTFESTFLSSFLSAFCARRNVFLHLRSYSAGLFLQPLHRQPTLNDQQHSSRPFFLVSSFFSKKFLSSFKVSLGRCGIECRSRVSSCSGSSGPVLRTEGRSRTRTAPKKESGIDDGGLVVCVSLLLRLNEAASGVHTRDTGQTGCGPRGERPRERTQTCRRGAKIKLKKKAPGIPRSVSEGGGRAERTSRKPPREELTRKRTN